MKDIIIMLAAFMLLASCTTQRKAESWMNKNQPEAAAYCANRFPDQESVVVKENIVIDTQFFETPGDWRVYVGGDIGEFEKPYRGFQPSNADDLPFKIKCPPTKVITKTVRRDSIITKVDGALVASLRFQVGEETRKREAVQKELQDVVVKADKMKAQRNKLRWIVFFIAGAVATFLGFKVARWLGNWGPFFKAIGK